MANPKSRPRRWLTLLVLGLLGLALIGLAVWGVMSLMGGKSGKARKPPVVTLLPDKPPPPPPPPKEEKKPEPPKDDKKEVKVEQPKEQAPPAQNEPLKMEGAAGDGPSAFGAGSVGRDYVGGNIGGGAQQGIYAGRLQRHLQEQLNRNRKLKESDYRVTLRVWLRRDGSVEKADLAQSTGSAALDELLKETLLQVGAMRDAPPENMPQPIRIRVTARGSP
ncbi:energy transducer TonB [Dechloromonas denitrificans]|uniref:energy transducer TonB family protein n=1 Tax=Dechloromonas denitrificans TaxID=281362 RepID=UPI001CF84451|nr:energy transducer TonB [Dechloromonas denitrificans]UCV05452.1 TonB family protein [Dechloromonas denitrificans]